MRLPVLPARLAQIDLLKALAIIAVIGLHSLTADQVTELAARWWIGQAVPVFAVVMGLNATASLWQSAGGGPRAVYTRSYILSRFDRLYVPFLAVFVLATIAAAAQGTLTARQLGGLLTGTLPIGGPGNYFIPFVFQFAIVFPLLAVSFRRWPAATVAACLLAAFVGELAAPHLAQLVAHPYAWDASLLRLLPFVAVGMLLAEWMLTRRPLPAWWWAAAAVSAGYLVVVTVDAQLLELSLGGWRALGQTSLAAFYAGTIVVLGLRYLPASVTRAPGRLLTLLGVASFEIFLLQILWFGVVDAREPRWFPISVVVCSTAGVALHLALQRVPRLTAHPAAAK